MLTTRETCLLPPSGLAGCVSNAQQKLQSHLMDCRAAQLQHLGHALTDFRCHSRWR